MIFRITSTIQTNGVCTNSYDSYSEPTPTQIASDLSIGSESEDLASYKLHHCLVMASHTLLATEIEINESEWSMLALSCC